MTTQGPGFWLDDGQKLSSVMASVNLIQTRSNHQELDQFEISFKTSPEKVKFVNPDQLISDAESTVETSNRSRLAQASPGNSRPVQESDCSRQDQYSD